MMRSSTIRFFRRATLVGSVLGPTFWVLKWILSMLHVLKDSPAPPRTLTDALLYNAYWEVIG